MIRRPTALLGSLMTATALLLAFSAAAQSETRRFKPTQGVQTFAVREPVCASSPATSSKPRRSTAATTPGRVASGRAKWGPSTSWVPRRMTPWW